MGGNFLSGNITGGWGGLRDELVTSGISFQAAYLGQFSANPVGGESQGQSYRGDLAAGAFVDLQTAFDIDRTYFVTSLDFEQGTSSLSPEHVGNQFPVQLSSGDDKAFVRLVHLALGTQLLNNTVAVNGGRLLADEQYANLAQACNSLNQAICQSPIAAAQSISFPTYPFATWGANIEYKPGFAWYAKGGAFLVNSDMFDAKNGGVNFGLADGSGPLVIGELGYLYGKTPTVQTQGFDRGVRPIELVSTGTYKLGAYYDGEELSNLSTGDPQRHTWGIYAMGEQRIYGEASHSDDGLWTWLSLSYAPPDVNEVQFMVAGGLSYNGLIDGRPDDTMSFTFAHGQFSDRLEDQGGETLLEFGLRLQAIPSVYVEPNLQYIINPDGLGTIDNALVAGVAFGLNF